MKWVVLHTSFRSSGPHQVREVLQWFSGVRKVETGDTGTRVESMGVPSTMSRFMVWECSDTHFRLIVQRREGTNLYPLFGKGLLWDLP